MLETNEIIGSKQTNIELPVYVSGTTITIGAGPFVFNGVSYELDDDVVNDFSVSSSLRYIIAYLVRVVNGGEITVMWDEHDGTEMPYVFGPDSPYQMFERLIFATIPANASDFSDESVRITAYRLILPQEGQ